jgi:GntR family transcriptional regulator/MocR family aminotransferase
MARRAAASLPIHLDPRAHGDLHEQIYRELRRAIVARILRPRTRIASSRALAADLGVSRTTTQLALDKLCAEGYLVARRGAGTFVAADLPDEGLPGARTDLAPGPPVRAEPPALSRRGATLATGRPAARRLAGPARAFRLGVPALEQFPIALWSRLSSRRVSGLTLRDLDYGAAAGLPALRDAIADHMRMARGARCDAEHVYIVGGAQRGIDIVCRLLLDAGASAAVEDPGFPGAWSALAAAGAKIIPVPVDDQGASVDALAGEPGVRLVYVTPSHQFPSGMPMSLPRRLALLGWAAASGAWIVEDDYDCEFRFGAQPIPCLQGLDDAGRVIYIGTFSKSIYPALRLGFVIAPAGLHERLVAARRALADPQPPFLEQAIVADFIAEGHFARHLRRMRTVYAERLEALNAAAAHHCPGVLALRTTRTGLHAVADLIGVDAGRVSAEAMQRGVEVMPLSDYVLDPARGGNALVLGFGAVTPERLADGMRELAAAIAEVQRRTSEPFDERSIGVATSALRKVAI